LVDPKIWTGTAVYVDSASGDDSNNGLGAYDGDFSAPKRTIYGAFATGNATGSTYSALAKAGQYEESAFTRNCKNELIQPVAIAGWVGAVRYRTCPFSVSGSNAGATYSAPVSSVKCLFRTYVLTVDGCCNELPKATDLVYATDFQLCPKDSVFVVEQRFTRWERAMSPAILNFYGANSSVGNCCDCAIYYL
jgi:hypothetical protein